MITKDSAIVTAYVNWIRYRGGTLEAVPERWGLRDLVRQRLAEEAEEDK